MKACSMKNCQGQYEKKYISRLLKYKGKSIVLENVPADVCSFCGDTLISLKTQEEIEMTLKNLGKPSRAVPLYSLAEIAESAA
jgi:YgiT-type zinc finger domain-containing protein